MNRGEGIRDKENASASLATRDRGVASLLRILSLDSCLAGLSVSVYAAYVLEAKLPSAWYFIFFLAIWLVYTLDHLLDGEKCRERALTRRHRFHYRHRKILWKIFVLGVLCLALFSFMFLPLTLILSCIGLSLFLGAYFFLIQKVTPVSKTAKEFMCALAFTAGAWSAPLFYATRIDLSMLYLFFLFFILAFCNMILFADREKEIDKRCQFPSLVQGIGSGNVQGLNKGLLLFVIVSSLLSVLVLTKGENLLYLPCLIMGLALLGVSLLSLKFSESSTYRLLGDGIFYLPVLLLVFR